MDTMDWITLVLVSNAVWGLALWRVRRMYRQKVQALAEVKPLETHSTKELMLEIRDRGEIALLWLGRITSHTDARAEMDIEYCWRAPAGMAPETVLRMVQERFDVLRQRGEIQ